MTRVEKGGLCARLVDGLTDELPEIRPARKALIALLSMGPAERPQGWSPKRLMYMVGKLGESLEMVYTLSRDTMSD